MRTTVYMYLFDTLSDWEIGYITTGINNPMFQTEPGKYQLKTFSLDGKPIRTLGGLQVMPNMSMAEVSISHAAMLIFPGGTSWDAGENKETLELAKNAHADGVPVAAICGATSGLARAGLLDFVAHTSNAKEYILMSQYKGGDNYKDELAVSDNGIITATGTAPLEFSREVFRTLGLYKENVLNAWYRLFKTNAPEAFWELMSATQS